MAAASPTSNVYEFKITLRHVKPPIWRRIQVPGDYTFYDLHLANQNSMGWWNYHLHKFEMMNPQTGDEINISDLSCNYGFDDNADETKAKIADYFLSPKNRAFYKYDFGTGWGHDIVLEKIFPKVAGVSYPRCVAGKRACPPEDGNFANLPKGYEPEEFDPKKVDFSNTGMLG